MASSELLSSRNKHAHTGESPAKGHENNYKIGAPLLWGEDELRLLSLKKRRPRGVSSLSINTWGRLQSGKSQALISSAQYQNRRQWEAQEVPSDDQEALFLLCRWWNIDRGCPERLWSLLFGELGHGELGHGPGHSALGNPAGAGLGSDGLSTKGKLWQIIFFLFSMVE